MRILDSNLLEHALTCGAFLGGKLPGTLHSRAPVAVMDCMSYSTETKLKIAGETGKLVILVRTLVARMTGELLT